MANKLDMVVFLTKWLESAMFKVEQFCYNKVSASIMSVKIHHFNDCNMAGYARSVENNFIHFVSILTNTNKETVHIHNSSH